MKNIILSISVLLIFTASEGTMASTSIDKVEASKPSPHFKRAGVSLLFWQESIRARKNGESTNIETQLEGIQLRYNYNIPFTNSMWRQYYEANLSFGRLKGKGNTLTIADELKDQPWYSLTLSPGIMLQGTPHSEFGISLPLSYRVIQWDLKGGGLTLEKDRSFSTGISGMFLNHLSERSSLNVTLTYQLVWESALWSIGWEYRL